MAIVRWDPMRELEDMQKRFQGFFGGPGFGSFLGSFGNEQLGVSQWMPAVDVSESPEAYTISAELPDVKKEDIKINISDNVLTLSGERRQEREEKGKRYHRVERSFGQFQRAFTLPGTVDDSKVSATYRDGVLHIQVPKTAGGQSKSKEIKVT